MSSAIHQAALTNECRPTILEAAERIALPMICFASRRLSVLATPPSNFKASVQRSQLSSQRLCRKSLFLTAEWDRDDITKMVDGD